ncbi:hypothetical protein VTK26DRAFT_3714 [Humicola hyalothermophila]
MLTANKLIAMLQLVEFDFRLLLLPSIARLCGKTKSIQSARPRPKRPAGEVWRNSPERCIPAAALRLTGQSRQLGKRLGWDSWLAASNGDATPGPRWHPAPCSSLAAVAAALQQPVFHSRRLVRNNAAWICAAALMHLEGCLPRGEEASNGKETWRLREA